jgi:hypothetical protein
VYKVVIHRLIWFPYRPEQALAGPLLMALLFLVAATGVIKAIDIFTPFVSTQAVGSETWIIAVVIGLCLVICIVAARSDYIAIVAAVIPCLNTVLIVTALSLIGTWPKSTFKLALVQASVSSFAALSLAGKLVQSGGPDLGNIGVHWRHAKSRLRQLLNADIDSPDFKMKRAQLVQDVGLLAKALTDAAPQVIDPEMCNEIAKRLESFLVFARLAEHADFVDALTKGRQPLRETLQMLNEGLR